jgi:molybdopterin-biosynthesis enzyme MoeA-like protein
MPANNRKQAMLPEGSEFVSAEKRPFFLVAARPDAMPGARGASG